jgi:hypothetical protein
VSQILPLFRGKGRTLTILRRIITNYHKMKLTKMLVGGAVALAMVLPFAASAATISNPLFSNGQTSIDATGGSTVSGTFTLTVGAGEVVEWLRTQSDPSQPFVDTSVGGQLGYQEQVYTNVPFNVKVTPNTGTIYPTVQGAGTFGGGRSINGGDNVVLGPANLGTVRVVASSFSTVGSTPLEDLIASLTAQIGCMNSGGTWASNACVPKPAPVVNTACAEYASLSAGLSVGSDTRSPYGGGRVGQLQGFLLGKGGHIPLLETNKAPYGFYGVQTDAAVNGFVSANHCN